MKNYLAFTSLAFVVLFYICNGKYTVGSGSLNGNGFYESETNDSVEGDYYCQKYQSTVFADSGVPTALIVGQSSISYPQVDCVEFYKLQLSSAESVKYISVDVKITSTPSSHKVSPLFAYKIGSPPLMTYDSDLKIKYDSVQFDFNGKLLI